MTSHTTSTIKPLTYTVHDTMRLLSLGKTSVYELIAAQRLTVVRINRRTLIKADSIARLIDG